MLPVLFFKKIATGAQASMQQYGVLACVHMAQAACESGYGKHAPGNNLFGVKSNGWKGKTQILYTHEVYNGKSVYVYDIFRVYNTWSDSIKDHALFLKQNGRYHNLIGCKDYKIACKMLLQDGYATEPDYADTLISIIEKYKLCNYDILPALLTVDEANAKVVRGWALNHSGLDRVDLYIDRNIGIGSHHDFNPRPDVLKAYPNYKTLQCGFAFDVTGKIGRGRHVIKLAAIGKDKSVKWVSKSIKI